MGIVCPNCKHENKTEAVFCVKCGTRFKTSEQEVISIANKKKRGCLIYFFVFLILFVSGITSYLLLARPYFEDQLLSQLDNFISDGFHETEYQGGVKVVSISEDDVTDFIETLNIQSEWVSIDGVKFEQDDIILMVSVINRFQIEYHFDCRVDSSGNIVIKKATLPIVNHLLFKKSSFINSTDSLVNEYFLEKGNIKLLSIQVTEGQVFYAYDSRD